MLSRDALIREYRARAGSWPALLVIYALLLSTMALSASAIL